MKTRLHPTPAMQKAIDAYAESKIQGIQSRAQEAVMKERNDIATRATYKSGAEYGRGLVDDTPTIDPESLRPTAHWISDSGGSTNVVCSACNAISFAAYNFCPECGKRMVSADE